jgi:AmiR/NasT family two-component response regulator
MHRLLSDDNPSSSPPFVKPQADRSGSVLRGKRVVIVEDEGITQLQLHRILTFIEMVVVGSARSGPQGVDAVLREKPDLVLMDIRMPGEYDGLEAARRILAVQSICVVMLTAFSEQGFREQAQDIGVCGYIIKPIDQDTLIPQLEAALSSFRAQ